LPSIRQPIPPILFSTTRLSTQELSVVGDDAFACSTASNEGQRPHIQNMTSGCLSFLCRGLWFLSCFCFPNSIHRCTTIYGIVVAAVTTRHNALLPLKCMLLICHMLTPPIHYYPFPPRFFPLSRRHQHHGLIVLHCMQCLSISLHYYVNESPFWVSRPLQCSCICILCTSRE
jgi:hypothetical protein